MPKTRSQRLTRDIIVNAALEVSRVADGVGGSFPTGQAVGHHLGVDRSSIWRHFRDRDDLVITVADAMLAPVANALSGHQEAEAQLRTIWNGMLDAFERHPYLGVELGNRFLSGPHVATVIEKTLDSFVRLGVSVERAGLYQNAFADLVLAAGAARARHTLMTADERASDLSRSATALRSLDPDDFSLITANIETLASPDPAKTADMIFECFLLGVLAEPDGAHR